MSIDFECFEPILQDPPKEGRNRERMDGPSTRRSGHLPKSENFLLYSSLSISTRRNFCSASLAARSWESWRRASSARAFAVSSSLRRNRSRASPVVRSLICEKRGRREERQTGEGGRRTESDGRAAVDRFGSASLVLPSSHEIICTFIFDPEERLTS